MTRRSIRTIAALVTALAAASLVGCGNGDFTFGQALQAVLISTDSNIVCGPVSVAPLVPDCPIDSACFTPACDNHNKCYSTCGTPKQDCDHQFFHDMVAICNSDVRPLDADYATCRYFALLYWYAVVQFGQQAYDATQVTACALEDELRGPPGACCRSSTGGVFCEDVGESYECPIYSLFLPNVTCDDVDATFGGCPVPLNDDCAAAEPICEGQQPVDDVGRCDSAEDSFGAGQACDVYLQDCADDVSCLPVEGDAPVYRCIVPTDTRLATTDGPDAAGDCEASGPQSFQADVWYTYIAPCDGTLTIQMCNAGFYDSMLAVYGDSDASGACVCPDGNEQLLVCNDDYCGGAATLSGLILEDVVGGACYTIRVGGWSQDGTAASAQRGVSQLDIGVFCKPTNAETATP